MADYSSPPASRSNDRPALSISKQPSHVFDGELFEIDFCLESPSSAADNSPPLPGNLAVRASADGAHLVTVEEARISASRRTGKLRARLESATPTTATITLACVDEDFGALPATAQLSVVRAKLKVLADGWSPIWYKDEGGRDKSMEATIEVVDKNGRHVAGRLPLSLTLCYQSHVPVTNQDLFRRLGHSKDYDGQPVRLRFRIEDVSKNHQGQNFCVRVDAGEGIAPVYTDVVSVRSKRNKRQRAPSSAQSAPVRTPASFGSATTSSSEPLPLPRILLPPGESEQQLREAIHGVQAWAEEVVGGLYHQVQWQILGYATLENGEPDYTRPQYSMQNPNPFVQRMLGMYSETVRGQLRLIEQAIMQSAASSPSSQFGMMMMAPRGPMPPPMMVQRGMPPPQSPLEVGFRAEYSMSQPSPMGAVGPAGFYARPPPMMPQQRSPPPAAPAPPTMARFPDEHEPLDARLPTDREASSSSSSNARSDTAVVVRANREQEVEYVLAKQYKSLRTGERLGFPAYSSGKELLGFYQEGVGGSRFLDLDRYTEDSDELRRQAASALASAKSDAVHALRDWGSIGNLLDHALVYDWSKDINNSSGASSGGKTD